MVKADAYGLGADPVARALHQAGCRTFFVATIAEAIALRGVLSKPETAEIFVFEGHLDDGIDAYVQNEIRPVLNTEAALSRWAKHGRDTGGARAAIMIDTGMARLGLDRNAISRAASMLDGIELAYVMSHLACGDEPSHPLNAEQRARFDDARARLPAAPASLANSAGVFLGADYHYDLVRPGAAIYGLLVVRDRPNPQRPVVRLRAKIVQLRDVDSETAVGYGATRLIAPGRTLATVAMGYADGLSRALSNLGSGRIGETSVPLVGRVSMDLSTFDVTGIAPALVRPGCYIDLIDETHDADHMAAGVDTIGYEILSRLGPRVRRVYHGAGTTGDKTKP